MTSATATKRTRSTKLPRGYVLVLRTVGPDYTSHNGFVWPKSGKVSCDDWRPTKQCGNGLHGLLWGEGDGSLLNWSDDAVWQVVTVRAKDIVDLNGKVKFPRGVVWSGSRDAAVKKIVAAKPDAKCVARTSTSGYRGTSTSGYRGTSTSGDGGTSTSGDGGTSTSGYGGTSTSGYGGTSTSGDGGTSTSGYRGTSTSGYGGTSTSGYGGTSTSGDRGYALSRYGMKAKSGINGAICISYSDGKRERFALGYVGEDGIKPDTWYCVKEGKLVEVDAWRSTSPAR